MTLLDQFKDLSLTSDQQKAVQCLSDFLVSDNKIFLLKGYAGSGKTTLLKGIADHLSSIETPFQLMAPTGRAAKVIHDRSGKPATTIHKGIYSFSDFEEIATTDDEGNETFLYSFKLRNYPDAFRSVFLVDEASMISNILSVGEFFRFGTGHLLNDLFTFAGILDPTSRAKIIFIGDPAQLPPIGMNFSPALDEQEIAKQFGINPVTVELTQVVRQNGDNTILRTATRIRQCLKSGFFNDFDLRSDNKYIFNPSFQSFLYTYKAAASTKIIITFKNKTALDLNMMVRSDKYGADLPLQIGDTIIIGANNYKLGILNGEMGVVANTKYETISRTVAFKLKNNGVANVTLTWRFVELVFPDIDNNGKTISGYMLENYLYGDNYLTSHETRALYIDFKNRHPDLKPDTKMFEDAIAADPFFNCIFLKYGYAVTCHKAQGGEWDNAFVFWDYGVIDNFDFYNKPLPSTSRKNAGFYRWAYTAVTRALKFLHLINPPFFNSFSGLIFIDPPVALALEALTNTSISQEEIFPDENVLKLLHQFNLDNGPISIQNHFIKLNFLAARQSLSITAYSKKGYEIWCTFSRANEFASIKYWVNGRNEFNTSCQLISSASNSTPLGEIALKLCKELDQLCVVQKPTESVSKTVAFDLNTAVDKPFLGVLFDALKSAAIPSLISITEIEHLEWRKRYTFQRNAEVAKLDIEYNSSGFFGRVLVLEKKTNSALLINDLKSIVNGLKSTDYVN